MSQGMAGIPWEKVAGGGNEKDSRLEESVSESMNLIVRGILEGTEIPKRYAMALAILHQDRYYRPIIVRYLLNMRNISRKGIKELIESLKSLSFAVAAMLSQSEDGEKMGFFKRRKFKF